MSASSAIVESDKDQEDCCGKAAFKSKRAERLLAIARFELKNLFASRSLLIALLLIFCAGVYSIYFGKTQMQEQSRVLRILPQIEQDDIDYVRKELPNGTEAGSAAYYHFHPTLSIPDPWSALSIGQRDVHPYYLQINMQGVYSQLFNSGLENPVRALAGNFDFSFVIVMLFPLLIIGLSYDLISSEEERGTLRLLLSLSTPLWELCLVKAALRFGLVLTVSTAIYLLGLLVNQIGFDQRVVLWFAVMSSYFLFWFTLVLIVCSLRRDSATTAVSLLGIWLVLSLIIPSLANIANQVLLPLPNTFAIAVSQRQEVHAGWDKSKSDIMQEFCKYYPELLPKSSVSDEFSYKWYYAMQDLADKRVEPSVNSYMENLQQRQQVSDLIAIACAPVQAQLCFNKIACSDLGAELAYLKSVVKFHNELKKFFYPQIFSEKMIKAEDYLNFPKHRFSAKFDPSCIYTGLGILTIWSAILAILIMPVLHLKSKESSWK